MSAGALVAGLWRREPDAWSRVLQNARLHGFGGEAYGTEAARDLWARAPVDGEEVETVAGERGAATFGVDAHGRPAALFADLHAGSVTRLWRLGAVAGADRAADATAVPVDLDCNQRGGRLAFDPDAHAELAHDARAAVVALGEAWLLAPPAPVAERLRRVRPLVLRAVSQSGCTAVLFRLEGASGAGLAGAFAATLIHDGGETRTVVDEAGLDAALARPWLPHLR